MSALSELYTVPQEHLDFRDTIREIAQERIAPTARRATIYEGTNEIQRLVIARTLR